jgi:hypothetical protein
MHTDARTQCTPAQNNKICLQISSVCIVRARTCRGYAYYYESSQLYMNIPRAAYKQQYCTDQYDSVNINRHVRYEYFCTSRHLFVAVCIDDSTHSVRRHTFSATAHIQCDGTHSVRPCFNICHNGLEVPDIRHASTPSEIHLHILRRYAPKLQRACTHYYTYMQAHIHNKRLQHADARQYVHMTRPLLSKPSSHCKGAARGFHCVRLFH